MLRYLKENDLDLELAKEMLWGIYQHPETDLDSLLKGLHFKRCSKEEIEARIPLLKETYKKAATSKDQGAETKWIMGELRKTAAGNMDLAELKNACCN